MRKMLGKMAKAGMVAAVSVAALGFGTTSASAACGWRTSCTPIQTKASCSAMVMPNVVGQTLSGATFTLKAVGHTGSVAVVVYWGPGTPGTVTGQNPAAGVLTDTCVSVVLGWKRG